MFYRNDLITINTCMCKWRFREKKECLTGSRSVLCSWTLGISEIDHGRREKLTNLLWSNTQLYQVDPERCIQAKRELINGWSRQDGPFHRWIWAMFYNDRALGYFVQIFGRRKLTSISLEFKVSQDWNKSKGNDDKTENCGLTLFYHYRGIRLCWKPWCMASR